MDVVFFISYWNINQMSSSKESLPTPRPLRTVRESFPSYGSSLSKEESDYDSPQWPKIMSPLQYAFAVDKWWYLEIQIPRYWRRTRSIMCPVGRTKQAFICFPSLNRFSKLSYNERPTMKVSPLSCRANFEPVSAPLQRGIRFFRYPLPAPPSASLTVYVPVTCWCWSDTGLPCSAYYSVWVRLLWYPDCTTSVF